jgi:hypothetical protein
LPRDHRWLSAHCSGDNDWRSYRCHQPKRESPNSYEHKSARGATTAPKKNRIDVFTNFFANLFTNIVVTSRIATNFVVPDAEGGTNFAWERICGHEWDVERTPNVS